MADYTSVDLHDPRIEPRRAVRFAGIRRRHQKDGFDFAEFPRQISEMKSMLPGLEARVGNLVCDIFWGMLDDADYFDYLVGVVVSEDAELPEGFSSLRLPAQSYAIVTCPAGGDPRDTVYTLWHEWLPEAGAVPVGADAPEFIYEHAEGYREEERNERVEIFVPVRR